MKSYLLLRVRILSRQLAELGWWRLLLLGLLLVVALGRGLVVLAPHPVGQWLVPLAVFLLIVSWHRRRNDLEFLLVVAPSFRLWLAAEYAFWSVPAMLGLLGMGQLAAALLTVALVPLAAWTPSAQTQAKARHGRSMFRSEAFEWVSGFRQPRLWLLWLTLLLAAGWWQPYSVAPAAAMGVWLLVLCALYATPEPWTMLLPALRQPGAWLRRRVALALLYFLLSTMPFAWFMGTGPAGWVGAGALLVWGAAVQTMVVLARYAFYPHAVLVRLTQAAVVAVAGLLFGHPVFPALLLIAFFGLLWKSRQQLATFRHD